MVNIGQLQQEVESYQQKLLAFEADHTASFLVQERGVDSCRTLLCENHLWSLYRYHKERSLGKKPLLIVYALLNDPSILDLSKGRSFIAALLEQDFDVFLLAWKTDESVARILSYHDYIVGEGLALAVESAISVCNAEKIDLLGICQGGVFSLCYSLLLPEKINRLILMGVPVDFKTENNPIGEKVRCVDQVELPAAMSELEGLFKPFFSAEQVLQKPNLISAYWINLQLSLMRPGTLLMHKYADFINLSPQQQRDFMQVERWLWSSGWLSAAALYQFIDDFYVNNGFITEALVIDGQPVKLSDLSVPVVNIYAEQDKIVPAAASKALKCQLNPVIDYQVYGFDTGHIGLYVNQKVQTAVVQCLNTDG